MSVGLEDLADLVFTGEIHPYADRWPMRNPDEIEAMAASIRANGLRFPIILSPDGVLVDGRNRLRACEIADVTPTFEVREELDTDEAITSFIWDANGDRRDMSKGAKAMLAALMPGRQILLSNSQGLSQAYVAKARVVMQFLDDEAVSDVINEVITLNSAYEEAQHVKQTVQAEEIAARKAKQAEKDRREREAKQLEDLRTNRPDLADLVDDGKLTLDDALTIRRKDTAEQDKREEADRQAIRNLLNDAHLAFATIDGYRHAEKVERLIANWQPQVRDYTADDLRELASILSDLADRWEH